MTPEQQDMFKEIILDHHQRPRNFGDLESPTVAKEASNPETGDQVSLQLQLEGDRVEKITFQAKGSAVLMASCSLMTVFAKGKTEPDIREGIQAFLSMLEDPEAPIENFEHLGDLIALAGIRQFPARVKCASLPWRTLQQCF